MKKLVSFLLGFSLPCLLVAQTSANFWTEVPESQIQASTVAEKAVQARQYKTFSLDIRSLKKHLANAPLENTARAKTDPVLLDFPMPDGAVETFEIWQTITMQPALAARFPEIRAFAGRSKANPDVIAHIDYSFNGFNAGFRTPDGTVYIDPYADGQDQYYIVYFLKDVELDPTDQMRHVCGFDPSTDLDNPLHSEKDDHPVIARKDGPLMELRTYVVVMGCTGEFGQNHGGTIPNVLSWFNTAANRLNLIFQPEVAFKIILHAETDKLIFVQPQSDPFLNAILGREVLGQAPSVVNQRINPSTYHFSHIFTSRCDDVGGVANLGSVCSDGNGSGVTCNPGSGLNVGTAAHEMGHQFTASHTFDNCPNPFGENARSSTGFEPGSGSTIMSYAGGCGNQNIQNGEDLYYHVNSLQQMTNFTRRGNGGVCPVIETTANHEPELQIRHPLNGLTIPILTPFELIAEATDADADALTYCWEQFNLSIPPITIGMPIGDCPIYRSYRPSANPNRVIPRLDLLLNNDTSNALEMLVDYSRRFNFRCTVRDNDPIAGGAVWDEIEFHTTDQAGPFLVEYPNEDTVVWQGGSAVEVKWDVANTYDAPVNCKMVDIRLSLDGGLTYPITLANKTLNDGQEMIIVPNVATALARVRIQASESIFFDISNQNFEIKNATEPAFIFQVSPAYLATCLPDVLTVGIHTSGILGFDSLVTIEVLHDLPSTTQVNISKNLLTPGEGGSVTFNLDSSVGTGLREIIIRAFAPGTDTIEQQILLDLLYNDFSPVAMLTPMNNAVGVAEAPTFSWNGAPDAESYDLQVATNPAFRPEQIVLEVTGITLTSYSPLIQLNESTPYYWRIRPRNAACGDGDYLPTQAFHTLNKICDKKIGLEGDNTRVNITGFGRPTVETNITILESGAVDDLNIPNIRGSYETINKIRLSLIGPDSTTVNLYEKSCSGSVFNFGFDDQISTTSPCPATSGRVSKPRNPLSVFNGKDISGNWTLRLEVLESGTGGGGSIEEWSLEYCGNLVPESPFIVKNDTMPVPPAKARQITNDFLSVQDFNNLPEELTFTLMTLPKHGRLIFAGNELRIGDQFRQSSINAGNVWYENNGDPELNDQFTFTVVDGDGGWLATPQFNIVIDEDAVVSTKDPDFGKEIMIFPNPATSVVNIDFGLQLSQPVTVSLANAQGQVVQNSVFRHPGSRIQMHTGDLRTGFYFAIIETEKGKFTRKVMIQN